MNALAKGIGAITLFTEDLPASKAFYADVFGLKQVFEDDVSVAFDFNGTIINVLAVSAAAELVAPAAVGAPGGGSRLEFSIEVDDVDAVVAELTAHGVTLLNGPIDRPWGLRTASFADPAGHLWEIGQGLGGGN
ncbi:MAG TPA: VOC family protein [Blastococcus sp.]|jgi:catechol 2,3-dioxygenase-like lactoylglutathione lyase family enzyme|nr:VOC family protein [Blastococcus sp.]